MTTQLQQSIKLLQLSTLELGEFLAQEIENNPLLTRDEREGSTDIPDENEPLQAQPEQRGDDYRGEERRNDAASEGVDFSDDSRNWGDEGNQALDAPQDVFWEDSERTGQPSLTAGGTEQGGGGSNWDSDYSNYLENTVSEAPSLQDHLRDQLPLTVKDPAKRMIGLHLIDLVDERGYVPEDLSQVAEALSCDEDEVMHVLERLQKLDPLGVFARSLEECLAIQLREKDRLDPGMAKLLKHLDLLATGETKRLAKLCGVEEEDIPFMLAEIRELNPKPGLRFGSDVVQTVVPDVFLRKARQGGWEVELNADALPKVLMNRQYYATISNAARRKEDKKYLSEQLAHANWLVKALDQRAQTILKVTTEIVKQQDAFFRYGVRHFQPMVLRDIAEECDLHESTVSRVTTQKYLSTGNAVYELKYFFSSSLGNKSGGDAHSSEAVKDMIREMVERETVKTILSDDAIAEKLQEKGVDIARRTVAKYREAMNIPSSSVRRREKKQQLS